MKAHRLTGRNDVLVARPEAPHGRQTISPQAECAFLQRLPGPSEHALAVWQGPAADPGQDMQQEFLPRLSLPSQNGAKTARELIDRQAESCRDDLRPRSRKTHTWPGRAPPQGHPPVDPGAATGPLCSSRCGGAKPAGHALSFSTVGTPGRALPRIKGPRKAKRGK